MLLSLKLHFLGLQRRGTFVESSLLADSSPLENLLALLKQTTDLASLSGVLVSVREIYGLANVVYHAVSIPLCDTAHPILLLTYQDDWVKRYTSNDYFRIDPVVRFGRKGFLPLDWSEVDHETLEAQRFFREADRYDVGRQGVTLPIRGPAGERALFTVTSNASAQEWARKCSLYMGEFQIIAHFVHDRAIALSGYRQRKDKVGLSPRETQCLALAIKGLHNKQIAGQLNLSTSIVQLYLQNARHKLHCTSLAEAAAKAVQLEIFDDDRWRI